jgi:predicted nucleic acid-binding protein
VKVLLDTNVWVAGITSRGLCHDLMTRAFTLHEQGLLSLLVCPAMEWETLRILADKIGLPADDLRRVETILGRMGRVPDGAWTPPAGFPDPDDVPIVGAALAAGATALVTGDKALLALAAVEGLEIIDPREAFLRLRSLL